jgi:hypothetical protein
VCKNLVWQFQQKSTHKNWADSASNERGRLIKKVPFQLSGWEEERKRKNREKRGEVYEEKKEDIRRR